MRNFKMLYALAVLPLLALSSGCSSLPKPPEVRVLAPQPTAPRLPADLRQPVAADFDKRIENSLADYYKSLATQTESPKSGIGLRINTSPTARPNERESK